MNGREAIDTIRAEAAAAGVWFRPDDAENEAFFKAVEETLSQYPGAVEHFLITARQEIKNRSKSDL